MEHRDFLQKIKNRSLEGIYLLHGKESYLMESASTRIKDSMEGSVLDFNFTQIDGENTNISDLVTNIETVPFMDDKKLVIINNFELLKQKRKNFTESDEKYLIEKLDNIPKTTVLIFMCDFDPDKRKSFFKAIKKNGEIIDCNKVSDMELFKWIRLMFAGHEVYINNPEIMYFIDTKGYKDKNSEITLNDLANEIEKISAYSGKGTTVTKDMIDRMTVRKDENDIFKFIDCLLDKNSSEAILIFNDMMLDGENILGIFAMLAREFNLLIQMKLLKEKGIKLDQAKKLLNLHPFVAKKAFKECDRVSIDRARQVIKYISDNDYKIKRGLINDKLSMEILIANYCYRW